MKKFAIVMVIIVMIACCGITAFAVNQTNTVKVLAQLTTGAAVINERTNEVYVQTNDGDLMVLGADLNKVTAYGWEKTLEATGYTVYHTDLPMTDATNLLEQIG